MPTGNTVLKTSYNNTLGDMVGVGLSGTMFGAPLNANDDDPFFPPAASTGGDGADLCGAHVNGNG